MIFIFDFFRKNRRKVPELRADTSEDETTLLTFFAPDNSIDRKSALEIPTVSACIGKIADTVSRLPVKLYRKSDGKITEITDDSRLKLLNGETGDTMNTVDFWKAAIEDYYMGKGAWFFINSDGMRVKSLHYIDNRYLGFLANTDPVFKAFQVMINGTKYYDFQFVKLLRKTRNGWDNIPVCEESSAILSAAYNALRLENTMSANGGCKSGFLKSKTKLSREAIDEIKNNYTSMYDNREQKDKKVIVLNDGIEFQEISATAAELQMNENKKANSIEICKIFGFPHTVIDGSADEEDNKKFVSAVIALLNQIETALDSSLLLESEKKQGYYWAFDTKELTRGNIKERYDAYEVAVRNNILQIDEIRREEDYEPINFNYIKLGLGDILYDPKSDKVFTPNTGKTTDMKTGEERAEELRGWVTKNGKHILIGDNGGSGGSSDVGGKVEKTVDNSAESGIIEEKQRIINEVIPNLKTDKVISRQKIHRQGTKEYAERQKLLKSQNKHGPSYVNVSDNEILQLVDNFKGKGIIKLTKNGKWDSTETIVTNDKIIGIVVNDITGKSAETSVFKIHYSKEGIHIVPDYPSKKR